jgi:D-alanyl-lipoteichoic acid acyltransferase DltB (MBOAT superfamily)|tara:strand:- start:253 stop:1632 length:1380 start_codon:yes stop_codon:yes gene_type:complete
MLLIASYVFYGFWDWRFLSLIAISTALDYICGLKIFESDNERRRKIFLIISIVGNFSILGFFKYFNFFIDNLDLLFGSVGIHVSLPVLKILLPPGISFYTFQTICYTFDIYRKKMKPTRNVIDFALYVSFFPQLVAGPIERAIRLLPQIAKPRTLNKDMICQGVFFIYWGLFLKMFVADNLGLIVDDIYGVGGGDEVFAGTLMSGVASGDAVTAVATYNGAFILLATYAFAFQIFGDFAGYSYIAIGLARLMGISLMDNFKRPYLSRDISEFWRRWHISLSTWFRDYIYIPLGGNQLSGFRTGLNLMVVFVLCGLWHGASWNFVLFGLYHGLLIWKFHTLRKLWERMPFILQIFLTFHLVCFGWFIFRVHSLSQLWDMTYCLFFNFHVIPGLGLKTMLLKIIGFAGVLVVVQILEWKKNDTLAVLKWSWPVQIFFYVLIFILTAMFGQFEERAFVYFQF